jgi:uncharacterized membrane protein
MADESIGVNPAFADWRKLPPVDQAKAWEKIRPGTFEQIWQEATAEGEHRRKLELADAQHLRRINWFLASVQLTRVLGAFAALCILAFVGIYFVNHHAPTQGASVFGVGGVALVGLFLGSDPDRIAKLVKVITPQDTKVITQQNSTK